MKNIKKFSVLLLSLVMVLACSSVAFAADTETISEAQTSADQEIQPRLYWNGSARLNSREWTDVVSDNNLIWANLKVTADVNNPGSVYIRVIDSSGTEIVPQQFLASGEEIRLPSISGLSSYTVQAKAVRNTGVYYFTITDITLPAQAASVQPRLYWRGSAYVDGFWCDLVSDNNLIWANLRVTSNKVNDGDVLIRVIDEDGNELVEPTLVSPDSQVYLSPSIPAGSSYIVQATVYNGAPNGTYYFTVTDVTLPPNEA